MVGTPTPDPHREDESFAAIVKRLLDLGENPMELASWRSRLDAVSDRLGMVASDIQARDETLALCHRNLVEERRVLARTREVLAQRDLEIADLRGRLDAAEERIVRLVPYKVSARYQLRALRESLPTALADRVSGKRGRGDGPS